MRAQWLLAGRLPHTDPPSDHRVSDEPLAARICRPLCRVLPHRGVETGRYPLPSSAIRYGLDVRPSARSGAGLRSWASSRPGHDGGPCPCGVARSQSGQAVGPSATRWASGGATRGTVAS